MHQYNHYFPHDATPESLVDDRERMLQGILGKIGQDCFIEPPINIDYGCNISIGVRFYSNFKYALQRSASVRFMSSNTPLAS